MGFKNNGRPALLPGVALILVWLFGGCSDATAPNLGDGGGGPDVAGADLSAPTSDGPRSEGGAADKGVDSGAADGSGLNCAAKCHGSASTPAPPVSVLGASATTVRGVGAHQAHLKRSTWHAPIKCTDCHLVPATTTAKGHIDTALPAEVTFSALAKTSGAKAAWNGTTCSRTYCHGSTLSGGTLTTPTWTRVDGTQAACGTCHSLPPTANHTNSTKCSGCHKAVIDAANKIIAPALHIDGKVSASSSHPGGYAAGSVHGKDFLKNPSSCTKCHGANLTGGTGKSCETCHPGWKTKCTFCHGGKDNNTGAPPEALDGRTSTTVPAVGQHTEHVATGATHVAWGCNMCHVKPASALSAGHIDPSPAEVKFSGLAAGANYSFSTNGCTLVYCHGNGRPGRTGSASWVGSLSGGCAACHDDETRGKSMTLSGEHEKHIVDKRLKCNACHQCVVNASKAIINKAKHVNGKIDVCEPSWNAASRSCNPACHQSETW